MSRLSIIVPTIGRDTLDATLKSIADQWDGEQVIVLAEQGYAEAEAIFAEHTPGVSVDGQPAWSFVKRPQPNGSMWGHNLRNFALDELVVGSHVATMDDDDIYVDGALEAMAEAVAGDAPVTVFKARWGAGHPAAGVVLWDHPNVAKGNIATPMVVAQRSDARYGSDYFGDFTYATRLLVEFPRDVWAWDERLICEVRPVVVNE